jgi:hypothetical protein
VENGYLFSGRVSGLDAFSPYRLRRGCPAVPARTTGKLVATAPCSSRTEGTLPSDNQHSQQIKSDLFRVDLKAQSIIEEGFYFSVYSSNNISVDESNCFSG